MRSVSDRHIAAGEAARLADPNLDRVCRAAEEAKPNGNEQHLEALCAHVMVRLLDLPPVQQVGIVMQIVKQNPEAILTTSFRRFANKFSKYLLEEFGG